MTLTDTQLHALARLGAIARLKEIEDEAAAIRRAFPGLKKAQDATAESPAAAAAPKPSKRKKRTRNVSPEARQAAAERMKAYWAKKKATQAAADAPAEATPVTAANKPLKGAKKSKRA